MSEAGGAKAKWSRLSHLSLALNEYSAMQKQSRKNETHYNLNGKKRQSNSILLLQIFIGGRLFGRPSVANKKGRPPTGMIKERSG